MFSGRFPFSEHIDELRRRLKVVAVAYLVVLVIVAIFPADPAYQAHHLGEYLNLQFIQHTVISSLIIHMRNYILPPNFSLIYPNGFGEAMEIYFVAALLVSFVICMPVLAYETNKFIDPALKPEERKLLYPFVTATSSLFAVGVIFGYLVLARFLVIALEPFIFALGGTPSIGASAFYYVVFLIIGATGASFTSPVFVYSLIRLRIIEADFFSRNRVIIWFVIWVITGLFLTPDGGPLLDLIIFIPIVAMVEAAVALARRSVRGLPPQQSRPGTVCPSCGTRLPRPMLFCDNCGKSIA